MMGMKSYQEIARIRSGSDTWTSSPGSPGLDNATWQGDVAGDVAGEVAR
jgi:hypothetical protein